MPYWLTNQVMFFQYHDLASIWWRTACRSREKYAKGTSHLAADLILLVGAHFFQSVDQHPPNLEDNS